MFPHCLGIARTSERGTRDLAMACAFAGVQLVDARCSNWSWRTWRRWLPRSLAPNRSANPDPSGASRALCEPLASPGQLGTRCPVLPDIHPVRLPRPMTPSFRGNPLVSCHHPPLVECCAEALLPRQGTAPGTHRYTPTHPPTHSIGPSTNCVRSCMQGMNVRGTIHNTIMRTKHISSAHSTASDYSANNHSRQPA